MPPLIRHCSFEFRDTAMASITERAQRMEKDMRETTAKLDRTAAELQVKSRRARSRNIKGGLRLGENKALP